MGTKDGAQLIFGQDTTIESFKDAFTNSPDYSGIEFHACPVLPVDQFHDFIVTLKQDLQFLAIRQSPWVDDETIEIFTAYCHKIKNLELQGSLHNVTRAGIESIGRNLRELESLSINCTNDVRKDKMSEEQDWTLDNSIFPALINNSSSQVQHFSLSGFKKITYDALRKLLDNFKTSLTSLDFSKLLIIDDASLEDIGAMCPHLTHLKINYCTLVTDNGVSLLSGSCQNLKGFEAAGCEQLTDSGIKTLAFNCKSLERVRLDNCSYITETSLQYLACQCRTLKYLSVKKTGVRYIPVEICRLKLQELFIDECEQLRYPRFGNQESSMKYIQGRLMAADISRRLKVVAVGAAQSGKTSILMSLQATSPNVADGDTFLVPVHTWMPFRDHKTGVAEKLIESMGNQLSEDDLDLSLEIWDCSGRKALLGVHPSLLMGRVIYILPFNVGLYNSADKVPQWISMIQAKTPNAYIFLIASHTDLADKEACHAECEKLTQKVKEMEAKQLQEIKDELEIINELDLSGVLKSRKKQLEYCLKTRVKIHEKVIEVSSISGQGCAELCDLIVRKALDTSLFPPLELGENVQFFFIEILNLREKGLIIQTLSSCYETAKSVGITDQQSFQSALEQLEELGCIMSFRFPSPPFGSIEDLVCIDPGSLANAVASIHRNEDNPQDLVNTLIKGGHLDPLWPAAKPNDWTLRGAFNNITSNGMIRETIIPLLLHQWPLDEEQAQMIISVMEFLVVLVSGAPNASYDVELILAYFKNLSVYKRYFLPMQSKLPVIPQVNAWLPSCPATHLQIGWSYQFAYNIPQTLLLVLISASTTAHKGSETISYWQNGAYLRVGDVDVAVLKNKEETGLDVLARSKLTNGSRQALNMGWCVVSRFLYTIELILSRYPGLFYSVTTTNMQTGQSKSLEEVIDACLKEEISLEEALWALPLTVLESSEHVKPSFPEKRTEWLLGLTNRCLVYVHHDSTRCGEMKSISYFFQNAGLVSICDADVKEDLRQSYIDTAGIIILVASAKYIDEQRPNAIIPSFEKGQLIVVATIEELSATDHAILESIFHGVSHIDFSGGTGTGAGYQVNRDQIRSLIDHCHTVLFGTGDIIIKQEEPEESHEGGFRDNSSDSDSDSDLDNDRSKVSWGGKVVHSSPVGDKSKKKRSVQFAESRGSMDEDTEVRKVAASAVAAAVAAATAEHIAKQSNPTMGAKAAAMAAKVADAVAKGDSDGASKAVIATAKAVDEVVAVASQRTSVTRTNGTVSSTEKGKSQSPPPPKSTTCVIL